jgi:two-component sensor histidine kinase
MAGRLQTFVERLPLLVDRPVFATFAAIGAAGLGLLVRLLASPWMPPGYPFLTFFPMVVGSTLLLGWKPGTLCAVVSGLLAWYFFITPTTVYAFDGGIAMALGFFGLVVGMEIVLIHALQTFVAQAARERETSRALAENRELLFRELQHRVSNNLQVVAALLSIQKRDVTDMTARAALDEASNRLALIGKISRQLHDPSGARASMGPFLETLCSDVLVASGRGDIMFDVMVDKGIEIEPDAAIPLALIVAESIANAVEHGFPDGSAGRIDVRLNRSPRDMLVLEVSDAGAGLPEGFVLEASDSLGLRIVQMLARQLGGSFSLASDGRTTARLTIPAQSPTRH